METVRGEKNNMKHHQWAADRGKKHSVNNWERETNLEKIIL